MAPDLGRYKIMLESQEWLVFQKSRHIGDYQVARSMLLADYNGSLALLNSLLSYNNQNHTFYQYMPVVPPYHLVDVHLVKLHVGGLSDGVLGVGFIG